MTTTAKDFACVVCEARKGLQSRSFQPIETVEPLKLRAAPRATAWVCVDHREVSAVTIARAYFARGGEA